MLIGAHVSSAGGLHRSVENAKEIGANCFGMFVRSQRRWSSPPLLEVERDKFVKSLSSSDIKPENVIVHGSYLINLANPDSSKREQSYNGLIDEMTRCQLLGLSMYNIHPGSAVDNCDREVAMSLIADCINKAHKEVENVNVVLETMAGQGTSIGSKFDELKHIMDLVHCKNRVGVCLDTCHVFAAGYDIRSRTAYSETMTLFDEVIGINNLKAIHLNDSKGCLGCLKDRHENIGKGFLGLEAFKNLVLDKRLEHIPMILETPESSSDVYKREIALLNSVYTF